jgi:putative drug exporter of the RND superfamily
METNARVAGSAPRASAALDGGGPFGWLGRLVVGHPWLVIVAWVAVAAAVVVRAPAPIALSSQSDSLPRDYESVRAAQLQAHALPAAFTPSALIVFERRDGRPLSSADSARVSEIGRELGAARVRNVQRVVVAPSSANRLVQTIGVQTPRVTNANYRSINDSVRTLRARLRTLVAGTDLRVGTTGTAAVVLDQTDSGNTALTIIFVATVVLIVVLLLAIFRSPIIALLPIVLIAAVAQVTSALIADAQHLFGLRSDNSTSQLLVVVLFGVGTDYILFLLFRFRERLRAGEAPRQAMVSAVTRVGQVIASAAGVVIVAFLTLALSTFGGFRSLGPSLAIAVAVTLVSALTLVPAVVSLLGTTVFWPSRAWRREPSGARFAALGRFVGRRTPVVAAASGLAMAALALGALRFVPSFDQNSGLPGHAESQVALQSLERGLPAGATQPAEVLLRSDGGRLDPAELNRYGSRLQAVSGVGQVAPPRLSADGTTADFTVLLRDDPSSTRAVAAVRGLRSAAHASAPAGTTALVGGVTSVYVDIQSAMNRDYGVVFPVAAGLVMLILALLLRSLVAPWYLMASVGLGFAATLGATTLLFQDLLAQSGVYFVVPMIIYMFVVALGTDYNILTVARLREEVRSGLPPREAAATAIRHAGPTIASAGLILAGSFASLLLAGTALIASYGFALSFGILTAAWVMAMLFTPGVTALLGRAAWWPSR